MCPSYNMPEPCTDMVSFGYFGSVKAQVAKDRLDSGSLDARLSRMELDLTSFLNHQEGISYAPYQRPSKLGPEPQTVNSQYRLRGPSLGLHAALNRRFMALGRAEF